MANELTTTPDDHEWIGIDISIKPDLSAWWCHRCDATGSGWPPQPVFCAEGADCPVRRMQKASQPDGFTAAVLADLVAEINDPRTSADEAHGLRIAHVIVRRTADRMGPRQNRLG